MQNSQSSIVAGNLLPRVLTNMFVGVPGLIYRRPQLAQLTSSPPAIALLAWYE
jgi:hypothetical protein